ncbi:MAG: glutaredoxin 3 [Cohaesibacteraceae bacterium]|nr:glutaredoxin 3 [Cohaesibacteraceae bacterium]MBL4875284.1 glutaredoxin 3 [Cohaesibacteraceae bacterium]
MANIVIYTRQMCGYCSAAKDLFSKKGLSFTEFDASFKPELKQEMIAKSNGGRTFPQIFVNDRHVGGCDDLFTLERSGKLDALVSVAV